MRTEENWPKAADLSTAMGWTVLVYETRALLQEPEDEDSSFLDEAELRALAAKLTWAADRLAARS